MIQIVFYFICEIRHILHTFRIFQYKITGMKQKILIMHMNSEIF